MHSGQLGLGVAAMENALKVALMRAQRWGAVMLIEEADVYIKRRDDDMTMKAVVGVFLRVLEYFSRLPFLTTHRIDDIDEADRRAGGHPSRRHGPRHQRPGEAGRQILLSSRPSADARSVRTPRDISRHRPRRSRSGTGRGLTGANVAKATRVGNPTGIEERRIITICCLVARGLHDVDIHHCIRG